MDSFSEIKFSPNAKEAEPYMRSAERFLDSLEHSLEEEVERIIGEEEMIGEGRTAKVFEVDNPNSPCDICAKIWRNKPRREMTPLEYRKIQYLTPEEEFMLQDELFRKGCAVPRPVAFGKIGERDVMVMEQLTGYDLKRILAKGGGLEASLWPELVKAWKKIESEGVVHRDLAPQNIFLETTDPLEEGAVLNGKIYIIDFGLSKRFHGTSPEDEDFRMVIGSDTVKYPKDADKIDELNPKNRTTTPFRKP
jgi:RIO-like serine/threonine protein kinase